MDKAGAFTRYIRLRNLSDLTLDLSGSLKIISNSAILLPICDILMYNNNHMSISHSLAVEGTQTLFS